MSRGVFADTGPLLALIDRRDQHHAWVRARFAELVPPLLTCEAVLTEACYLARRTEGGTHAVLDLLERGVLRLAFHLDENLVVVLHPPGEPGPVGAAQPRLRLATQDGDVVELPPDRLGDVGGAVRTAVVDHEHLGRGHDGPHPAEDLGHVGRLLIGGDDDQDA